MKKLGTVTAMTKTCDGECEACVFPIVRVLVQGRHEYDYCQLAIWIDRQIGYTVEVLT